MHLLLIALALLVDGVFCIPDDIPLEHPLKKLILVSRHGRRTPLKYLNPIVGGQTILPGSRLNGQLVDEGREEVLAKGRRYGHWLIDQEGIVKPYFAPEEWNIRSSGLERTIETGQYFMMGIFNATNERDRKFCDSLSEGTNCEAIIPILSYNGTNDPYLVPWEDCLYIQSSWSDIFANLKVCEKGETVMGKDCSPKVEEEIQRVFNSVGNKLGLDYLTMENLEYAFDPLVAGDEVKDGKYPGGVTEEERKCILDRYSYACEHKFNENPTTTKLLGSGIINYIINDLEEVKEAYKEGLDDYRQVSYYSAHDNTIMGFLAAINMYNGIADFASVLEIAVREFEEPVTNNPALYINISLNDEEIILENNRINCRDSPSTGYNYCNIDELISYLKSVSINMDSLDTYNNLCGNTVPSWITAHNKYNANLDKTSMNGGEIAAIVVGVIFSVGAIITGLLLFYKPIRICITRPKA